VLEWVVMEMGSPSDDVPAVIQTGTGDVRLAVFSLSARSPDGRDDDYVRWHLLDHLPEQHRIDGLRWGQRWRSTAACRAARVASVGPFDATDHVVNYLFAEPLDDALHEFVALGQALHDAGRMPLRLPSLHLGAYQPEAKRAADGILVGADVLPFRPNRGIYLVVERRHAIEPLTLDGLLTIPGVAGYWRHRGDDDRHPRFASASALAITVIYLHDDPVAVAGSLAAAVETTWRPDSLLLAGPFERAIVAW